MKLKNRETGEYIDLPSDGELELKSKQRIDVRPKEKLEIDTGLALLANKSDNAHLNGQHVVGETQFYGRSYKNVVVPLRNRTQRNIAIHPGDVIAALNYVPEEPKTMTFKTQATFTEEENAD